MKQLERPTDTEIRSALADVLASTVFARSERLRAFLSYVVNKDLAGQSMQLKGYTIAVDVFRRPDAFNADSDPLVRVHAGKLRKLLTAFYETEGREAVWQIEIPKGGYAPVYVHRPASAPAHEPAPQSFEADVVHEVEPLEAVAPMALAEPTPDAASPEDTALTSDPLPIEAEPEPAIAAAPLPSRSPIVKRVRPSWLPAPLATPVAMISLLPLLLFAPLSSTALGVSPQVQARLSLSRDAADIEVPRVAIQAVGNDDHAARLARQIRAAMDYYTVITPGPLPDVLAGQPPSKSALSFTISIAPAETDAQTRVTVSSDATGEIVSQIWIDNQNLSNDFDLLFESLGVAARTLATNGDLFHYAVDKGISSPLMQCMLVTDTYRREKSREALKEARICQEKLLGKRKTEGEFIISASELKRNVHP
ncbi:hypothetical protein ASG25_12570 [Rhizobium sp. Leaf384]|uniref:hypothetical protein n=1 Tax=unclassified Rhizobium TaxID=2613769 RepID=UPI000714205C|nr:MULTISPECIES: hypothetical protein [unclassified Rhizobium]KQS79364.1 hypothetical protein ASG25_12570 [Rhizobium sp. Leaf384]KQS82933.1 hypothetical protein ASG58_06385 [Rhizobium sp. Leaf383]